MTEEKIDIVMDAVPGRLHSTEAGAILAALCKAGFAVVRASDYRSETPSTGDVIGQMDKHLEDDEWVANKAFALVPADELRGWRDCVIEAAAMLDPDNPPLTPEQLKQMKRRQR